MSGRTWLGFLFLLLGFGFFLNQVNMIDLPYLLDNWWPLILIFIGVIQLISRSRASVTSGLVFLVIGILFFVNQTFDLNLVAFLWPLIFIIIGIIIMFARTKERRATNEQDTLNTFVLLSGAEIRSQSTNFQGGSATSILGGIEIDLRDAIIKDGTQLDLTSVLGGISLKVPRNVHVELSGFPILGGWEDNTRQTSDNTDAIVLKINCLTILGGAEIEN